MTKVVLHIELNKDNLDLTIRELIKQEMGATSEGQQKIVPICEECGKEVDQKVVNFCKVKFNGKILCRECQEGK